jgi:uncharacterized membrane protein (TIGR02234 family)
VLVLGVGAGAMTAVAAAKPWAAPAAGTDALQAAGVGTAGEVPLALALGLVALAAWGAMLVTRGLFRRVVAVIGAVAAVGTAITAVVGAWRAPHSVHTAVRDHLALSTKAADAINVGLTGWYWTALVASFLLVAGFAMALRDLGSWPSMGSRYDAPATAAERARSEPRTPQEIWKALDDGVDPTD